MRGSEDWSSVEPPGGVPIEALLTLTSVSPPSPPVAAGLLPWLFSLPSVLLDVAGLLTGSDRSGLGFCLVGRVCSRHPP